MGMPNMSESTATGTYVLESDGTITMDSGAETYSLYVLDDFRAFSMSPLMERE